MKMGNRMDPEAGTAGARRNRHFRGRHWRPGRRRLFWRDRRGTAAACPVAGQPGRRIGRLFFKRQRRGPAGQSVHCARIVSRPIPANTADHGDARLRHEPRDRNVPRASAGRGRCITARI